MGHVTFRARTLVNVTPVYSAVSPASFLTLNTCLETAAFTFEPVGIAWRPKDCAMWSPLPQRGASWGPRLPTCC